MTITLKQIEAFLAVAEGGSFSAAADRVHLSQPALSAAIQRLEAEVGARLFDRDTRTVALSSVGRQFLTVATTIADSVTAGMARMQDFLDGRRGSLGIAVAPAVAAGVLPRVLARFTAAHPDVRLRIVDVMSD